MNETKPSPLVNVITIDDERIKNHLDRVMRGGVEEPLNALLDAEADRLCNAQRYERTEPRREYECKLQIKAAEVKLRMQELGTQTFETAIIERYLGARTRSRKHRSRCTWLGVGPPGRGHH